MLRLKIAWQTTKDYWKLSLLLLVIFIGVVGLYSGFYPSFKQYLQSMTDSLKGDFAFLRGFEYMTTYAGFLNMELYQIFWILILGMLIGFLASSLLSKEVEGKTIDLLMANPVSRRQIVLEKYLGLVPFIVGINLVIPAMVYGITVAIGEKINLGYLILTHSVSIPYFLAVAAVGLLVSVVLDEKMKAGMVTIAVVIGMYIFESVSLLIPAYKSLGYVSLTHYYNPADILINGIVDLIGVAVLAAFIVVCVAFSMLYFDRRDIAVT